MTKIFATLNLVSRIINENSFVTKSLKHTCQGKMRQEQFIKILIFALTNHLHTALSEMKNLKKQS